MVLVLELLFLVTSVICVQIRGRRSEVATAYHFCSVLSTPTFLQVWIPGTISKLSRKHKTYRYSIQFGTLGVG